MTNVPERPSAQRLKTAARVVAWTALVLVVAGVVGLTVSFVGARQQSAKDLAARAARVALLPQRVQHVRDELERLGGRHPWAGEYHYSQGLSIVLWIAPDSGCVAEHLACAGTYGADWGTVYESNGKLHVTFEEPVAPSLGDATPCVFEIVGEGCERKLVNRDDPTLDRWFRQVE